MTPSENIDSRLLSILECPRDHLELRIENGHVCCAQSHRYPIVSGIPVFLLAEKEQTIGIAKASLNASDSSIGYPLYIDTLGISEEEKRGIERDWIGRSKIDPAIARRALGASETIGSHKSRPHALPRTRQRPAPADGSIPTTLHPLRAADTDQRPNSIQCRVKGHRCHPQPECREWDSAPIAQSISYSPIRRSRR